MKNPGKIMTMAGCICLLIGTTVVQADTLIARPGGSGARAMGMGGAFAAVADDATAVFWNPAGQALPLNDETATAGVSLGEDTDEEIWAAFNLKEAGMMAGSLSYQRRSAFVVSTDQPLTGLEEELWHRQTSYAYSVAFDLTPSLYTGLAVKSINDYLYEQESGSGPNGSSVSADMGIIYRWQQTVTLGVTAANILGQDTILSDAVNVYSYNPDTDEYDVVASYDSIAHPAVVTAGIAVRPLPGFTLAFDVYDAGRAVSSTEVRIGTEYRHPSGLAARLGNMDRGLTWGLGYSTGAFSLDFASVKRPGRSGISFLSANAEF